MAGGEYQPLGQLPSSEVANGQVMSRAFLPPGEGSSRGVGAGPRTPFPSAFSVFQGAILTTMLATRNFSGRCHLQGSSPCPYRAPRAKPKGPWRAGFVLGVTAGLRLQPGDAWHLMVVQARSPGTFQAGC